VHFVRIAVVIPALDEAETVEAAIASARSADVIVVVDGGSLDRTADRARAAGAQLISSPRGRALQLEAGWRATGAEVVLFLHADTRLPQGWAGAVRAALAAPDVAGGAFRLRFDDRSLAMRVVEWGAQRRAVWAHLPYGDQALFARRSVLDAIGGIAPVPIGEDLDLVRALRRRGRLALLPLAVATSARRYRAHGPLRTWTRNVLALAAWRLGVDREKLARWVRR
jgi:rSAM/selenodomain-associated transferase 2